MGIAQGWQAAAAARSDGGASGGGERRRRDGPIHFHRGRVWIHLLFHHAWALSSRSALRGHTHRVARGDDAPAACSWRRRGGFAREGRRRGGGRTAECTTVAVAASASRQMICAISQGRRAPHAVNRPRCSERARAAESTRCQHDHRGCPAPPRGAAVAEEREDRCGCAGHKQGGGERGGPGQHECAPRSPGAAAVERRLSLVASCTPTHVARGWAPQGGVRTGHTHSSLRAPRARKKAAFSRSLVAAALGGLCQRGARVVSQNQTHHACATLQASGSGGQGRVSAG